MTEERFAYRIRQGLNQNLDSISPTALRRLEAARHLALERQKQPAMEAAMAITGTTAIRSFVQRNPVRQFLAIIVLVLGMATVLYWQAHRYVADLEDVDSALLADELPPEAFLDKGFAAWLDDSSRE